MAEAGSIEFPSKPLTNTQAKTAETKLQRFERYGLISTAGVAWLKVAADPWHDNPVSGVIGCPDQNTGKSVVFPCNAELQLKKPDGCPAGNWQVRISTLPFANARQLDRFTHWPGVNFYSGDGFGHFAGPVTIESRADGQSFPDGFPQDQVANSSTYSKIDALEIPSAFTKGPFKIIGWGIEVINTTAELSKQGLLTVCRFNQKDASESVQRVYTNATGTTSVDFSTYQCAYPPSSLTEMLTHQGVAQWEAREGCYSVVPLKNLEAVPHGISEVAPIFCGDFATGVQPQSIVHMPQLGLSTLSGMSTSVPTFVGGLQHVPSDGVCIMLTGLSDPSSLTIRSRWIIERTPSNEEDDILAIASPSAYYDPMALEIYSRLMQKMPPGVMYKENPAGEWGSKILGGIADLVGPLLMAIPHPAAKAAGGAIMLGNQMLNPRAGKYGLEENQIVKVKKKNRQTLPASPKLVVPKSKAHKSRVL